MEQPQEQHKTLTGVRDKKANGILAHLTLPQPKAEDTSLGSKQSTGLAWNCFEHGQQQESGEMWNPHPTLYPVCSSSCSHTESVCPPQVGQEEGKWDCRNENMTPSVKAGQGPQAGIGNSIKTSLPMHSELGSKCNLSKYKMILLCSRSPDF